jgi:UDP-N-acetylmuramoylalanine--D-glutamate ligase
MAFLDHKTFFVFGAARSGRSVSLLLAERGHEVFVYDEKPGAAAAFVESDECRNNPSCAERVHAVGPDERDARVEGTDCLVLSPGVPLDHPLVARAREHGVHVIGEVEAAYHFNSARIIGVTGTNGKSTVVGVIGGILAQTGVTVEVAGNIGYPFAEAVRGGKSETLVLELSSFQLDTIEEFRADVAVLLNVTPDHLDRYHGSFQEYAASKARILNYARGEAFYVYNAEDEVATGIGAGYDGPKISFSSSRRIEPGVFAEEDSIWRSWSGRRERVMPRAEFSPIGVHNLENAMAGVAVATVLGVGVDDVRSALRAYRALPHRMELVRVVGGIAYVNDSKATNVDAAAKSLASVNGTAVVILGGRDKDGDFTALLPYLARVRLAVLIGEARGVIRRALEGNCPLVEAEDMEDAVRRSRDAAQAGDTVLLAPACASFDMFENYKARGEAFRKVVNTI